MTLSIPLPLLTAFPPSRDPLLDRLRPLIDDAMLTIIAEADYGNMANEMFAELRPIRDQGIFPSTINSHLSEVLHLTCWSAPDHPNEPPFRPGPTEAGGHRIRLFACAILLRAAAAPRCQHSVDDSTLALGFASAHVVGREMEEALACFLTWRLSQINHPQEAIYLSLTLLLLAAKLRPAPITDQVFWGIWLY